jgi:hypothetical protein
MAMSLYECADMPGACPRVHRSAKGSSGKRAVLILLTLVLLAAASPAAARAATGYRDFSWAAQGLNGPSAEKPQSKLWYNDGSWWGDMYDVSSSTWRIFRLDLATQQWVATPTATDSRTATWPDTLWDGTHLYIASAGRNPASNSDSAKLYRFSYSTATKSYHLDSGYPTTIVSGGMEAIVLDEDSTGALWATWTRNNQVYVNTTEGTGAWGTPFVLPVAGTTVDPDDISSVVSLKGAIGVMWSNQVDQAMYFAQHRDGDPATTWGASTQVMSGAKSADDHINLKSMQETNGEVFATVKTSFSDGPSPNPSDPLIVLLKRDPDTGAWSRTTVSTVKEDQTRPIVMLDPSEDKLYVFATTPVGGGTINSGTAETAIFYKTTSMSNPSFAPGPGTPFIQTDGDLHINDASSTKQTVSAASGLVVLASDNVTKYYMHNAIAPTSAPPPPGTPVPVGTTPTPTPPAGGPAPGTPGTTTPGTPGTVTNVCPANRSAVVRWILPKHHRMVSIVVYVAGKRYAKVKATRHSLTVHLGKVRGPLRIEIRAVDKSGKVYTAARKVNGCSVPSTRALRLVRVRHKVHH